MPELFPWFLFAHILGAIVAFGPSFVFPLIGGMGSKEPMHANFGVRVSLAITQKVVLPLVVLQGITGIGLVWAASIDVLAARWLGLSIVLYAIALAVAILVQIPSVSRVVAITTMPAGGPPPGRPAGPPPGLPEAVRRVQMGGTLLTVLIVSLVFLMVVKPSF